VFAVRQVPESLSGDLEDGVADRRLNRRRPVVAHANQPVSRREEADVDLGRIVCDPQSGPNALGISCQRQRRQHTLAPPEPQEVPPRVRWQRRPLVSCQFFSPKNRKKIVAAVCSCTRRIHQ